MNSCPNRHTTSGDQELDKSVVVVHVQETLVVAEHPVLYKAMITGNLGPAYTGTVPCGTVPAPYG